MPSIPAGLPAQLIAADGGRRPITVNPDDVVDRMSKDERSLLLFLEARAVDHGGAVAGVHMNKADFATVEKWAGRGFVRFTRMLSAYADNSGRAPTSHCVELSADAWACAAVERRRRGQRSQSQFVKESLDWFESLKADLKEEPTNG